MSDVHPAAPQAGELLPQPEQDAHRLTALLGQLRTARAIRDELELLQDALGKDDGFRSLPGLTWTLNPPHRITATGAFKVVTKEIVGHLPAAVERALVTAVADVARLKREIATVAVLVAGGEG